MGQCQYKVNILLCRVWEILQALAVMEYNLFSKRIFSHLEDPLRLDPKHVLKS